MKRVLVISPDERLSDGLEAATDLSNVAFQRAADWDEAQSQLVEQPAQAVCIDYETVEFDGHNSFVQLQNILQKEGAGAILLLRREASEAGQFVDTLGALVGPVNLSTDPVDQFEDMLRGLLEDQQDPAESRPSRPNATPTVEVVLPEIDRGDLAEHSIARVVHTIRQREWSGRLTLSTDQMEWTLECRDGKFVCRDADAGSALGHLKAAFAWDDGHYRFQRDDSIEGETVEPYPILLKGVQNHLDQRAAMGELTPVMDRYVARTSFFEECGSQLAGQDDFEAFVEQADGTTTLEAALSAIASRVLTGFQAGFLAIECDLVALTEEPTGGSVDVEFSGPEISAREQASGGREGVSPASSATSSHDEPETEEREAELRRTYDRIADASPYEVFDLWEGCGEPTVRDRYFELVKRHHPDSYGGNISERGKKLAEKIFIRIKQSYSDLLAREDEQEVSRDEAVESDTTGETTLDDSLSSPSVTAMGGGEEDPQQAAARADDADESSLEMGPTTEEMAAPAASKRPSTQQVEPEEDEARMRYGQPDDDSEATNRERDETVERRTEKLEEIRNRLEDKADRSNKTTPVGPGARNRDEKISSLNKHSQDEGNSSESSNDIEAPESEEEAQEYFNLGYRAYKNEDEAEAHRFFEFAYEYDGSNALWKTFYAYTLFLRDSRRRDDARDLLREVIESDDRQAKPDAHLFLGRILKNREEHDKAKRHFQRATDLDPNSVEAERELRVYEMREDDSGSDGDSDNFLSNLFDQDLF